MKNRQNEKIYRSMIEFEKEFFPDSYEKRLRKKKNEELGISGTGLVTELLEDIRRALAK